MSNDDGQKTEFYDFEPELLLELFKYSISFWIDDEINIVLFLRISEVLLEQYS
jgi:hypothetical protein